MLIAVSSMSGGQFWSTLKSEADTVSWNLRDVLRNNSVGESKSSLDRAIQSSERIVSLIAERTSNFKQQVCTQRKQGQK